jgi:hypothetical protein
VQQKRRVFADERKERRKVGNITRKTDRSGRSGEAIRNVQVGEGAED